MEDYFFKFQRAKDALGNALHREQCLLAEIERMKRDRRHVYNAYCDYKAKELENGRKEHH